MVRTMVAKMGLAKQTEDEISAINMAIGSALTGTRTMTATCGPGIALMQEGNRTARDGRNSCRYS